MDPNLMPHIWTSENVSSYKKEVKRRRRAGDPAFTEKKVFFCEPIPRWATLEQLQTVVTQVEAYKAFTVKDKDMIKAIFAFDRPLLSANVMIEEIPGTGSFRQHFYSLEAALVRAGDRSTFTMVMDQLGYDTRSECFTQWVDCIFK